MKERDITQGQAGTSFEARISIDRKLTKQPEDRYANLKEGVLFMAEPGSGDVNSGGPPVKEKPQPRGRLLFGRTVGRRGKGDETSVAPTRDNQALDISKSPVNAPSSGGQVSEISSSHVNEYQVIAKNDQQNVPVSPETQMQQVQQAVGLIENPQIKDKLETLLQEVSDPSKVWSEKELADAVLIKNVLPMFLAHTSTTKIIFNALDVVEMKVFMLAGNEKAEAVVRDVMPILDKLAKQLDETTGVIGSDRQITPQERAQVLKVLKDAHHPEIASWVETLNTSPSESSPAPVVVEHVSGNTEQDTMINKIQDAQIREEAQAFFRMAEDPTKEWSDEDLQKAYVTWSLQPFMAASVSDRDVVSAVSEKARLKIEALTNGRRRALIGTTRPVIEEIMRDAGISYGDLLNATAFITAEDKRALRDNRYHDFDELRSDRGGGRGGEGRGGGGDGDNGNNGDDTGHEYGEGGRYAERDPYGVPLCIEDLAKEVAQEDRTRWGLTGSHPVFQPVDGTIIRRAVQGTRKTIDVTWHEGMVLEKGDVFSEGEIKVNPANFVRWARAQMNYFNQDSPDTMHDFYQMVGLKNRKHKITSSITLGEMLLKKEQFFRTEDGKIEYDDLAEQLKRELYANMVILGERVTYEITAVMLGGEASLPEQYMKMKAGNPLTKKVWGNTSILSWVFSLPAEYQDVGKRLDKPSEQQPKVPKQDGRVGQAIATGLLFYKHLGDYKKLISLFEENQKDADLNTLDPGNIDVPTASIFTWGGFRKAIQTQIDNNPNYTWKDYLTNKEGKDISEIIFGKTVTELEADVAAAKGNPEYEGLKNLYVGGGATDEDSRSEAWATYITYMNFYNNTEVDARHKEVVRSLLRNMIGERYVMKTNDKDGEIVDDRDNIDYAEAYAYAMPRSLFIGAQNDTGRQAADPATKVVNPMLYRIRSVGSLFPEKGKIRGRSAGNIFNMFVVKSLLPDLTVAARTETLRSEKEEADEYGMMHYKTMNTVLEELHFASKESTGDAAEERVNFANELVFPENTERDFAKNVVEPSVAIYTWLNSAIGIDWDKVTEKYTLSKGMTIKRAEFQAEVLDKFMKPWSTMFTTWNQTDLSQPVRAEVLKVDDHGNPTGGTEYKTIPLGQKMFGYVVYDRPEFHLEREKWPKGVTEKGWDTVKWEYVNSGDGRDKLWANVVTTLLAAEIIRARDRMSHDKQFDDHYWMGMYHALETIPLSMMGNEMDMRSVKPLGELFDKERINWIKQKTGTQTWKFFGMDLLKWGAEPGFHMNILKQMFSGLL